MALGRRLGAFVSLFIILNSGAAQEVNVDPSSNVQLVAQGSKKELDCYVTVNSPTVNLEWSSPARNLKVDTMTDHTGNQYTVHRILIIDSFSATDVGEYTCTYTVQGSPTEYKISLQLVIENKLEGEFFYGNKSATLQCQPSFTSGAATASFQGWYKDGVPLSQLKKPERFTSTPENGTLDIDKPTREDAGEYVAIYTVTGGNVDTYNCTVEYIAAPLVLDLPKSINIEEEDTLDIECEVKGYPRAEVFWQKNSKDIEADPTQRIILSDLEGYKNAHLSIKSAVPDDAGTYSCEARADEFVNQSSKKSTVVRVRDPLAWLWPVIGIIVEIFLLVLIIFVCSKVQARKRASEDSQPEGSGRGRGGKKNE